MPGFDRTGPNRLGPRTGRGYGLCGQGLRRGIGYGAGYRRGYGVGYRAPVTNKQEKEILTEDMSVLQEEIETIKARIKELGFKK